MYPISQSLHVQYFGPQHADHGALVCVVGVVRPVFSYYEHKCGNKTSHPSLPLN